MDRTPPIPNTLAAPSLLTSVPPEILADVGRELHESRALRPALNAIVRTSHQGKALAAALCCRLTQAQAEEQWNLDGRSLQRYFTEEKKSGEREVFLSTVRAVANQLSMAPMDPYNVAPHYSHDLMAPEFVASIPKVTFRIAGGESIKVVLSLLQSQFDMVANARTEFTLTILANDGKSEYEGLIAAAERHGKCRFIIIGQASELIGAAASRQILDRIYFIPNGPEDTSLVASALKGNTSLREADITLPRSAVADELILALSGLPALRRLGLIIPAPESRSALAELVRRNTGLVSLEVKSSIPPTVSQARPNAKPTDISAAIDKRKLALANAEIAIANGDLATAMAEIAIVKGEIAKLDLKKALEARGNSLQWEIDPVFLPS